jgi:hypothetical protein
MRNRSICNIVAAAATFLAVATGAGAAHAADAQNVYTPYVYFGDFDIPGYGSVPIYLQAAVGGLDTYVDIRGAIISGTGDPTGQGVPLPQAWIRVNAVGYIDGVSCGETGWQYNSEDTSAAWNKTQSPCFRPFGQHEYTSVVSGSVWTGSDYVEIGPLTSPVLSY